MEFGVTMFVTDYSIGAAEFAVATANSAAPIE